MSAPKLIVLTGKAGCGKSSVANHLIRNHGFEPVKFASVLKDMLYAMGLTYDHIEGELKEQPLDILGGKTPRYAMQTLGTEWGRDIISKDLWVNIWKTRAIKLLESGNSVVTDDCRFENELTAARDIMGLVLKVKRPSGIAITESNHESENGISYSDGCIVNSGSISELETQTDLVIFKSGKWL
jgi:hypothetical protein